MPPGRVVRTRPVTNENDENGATTRLTRAKAAALVTDDIPTGVAAKKPLQSKKSTASALNGHAVPQHRKRAALGDVSNVNKPEAEDGKDVKKPLGGAKLGLVSKASQNAGVRKLSRTESTSRSILGTKKAATTELKRPGSGSGVMGGVPKKRQTGSTSSQPSVVEEGKLAAVDAAAEAPRKAFAVQVEKAAPLEVANGVKLEAQEDEPIRPIKDLDQDDAEDPLMCAEYVVEIFDHLKVLEESTMPNPDYMSHQDDLEWKMRGILVDWLIEVHTRFHLLPETLFLTVNIIDRFLSSKVVPLERLQLVGVTAMFIASKYEEVLSPHVANFRHVADDGFSEDEILSAERYVLAALNYDLSYPNPMNFLRRISKADNYDIQTRTLGKYLMEISLLDHRFMHHHPSHIAASAMYLARMILERGEWDATLSHYAGYDEKELEPVFKLMVDYLARPVAHEAFFKKYASKKFLKGESRGQSVRSRSLTALQLPSSPASGPRSTRRATEWTPARPRDVRVDLVNGLGRRLNRHCSPAGSFAP
ncbi:MAG: G2/mitotic-specific cyclin [Thelocarpon impressellum]|nr:MAG: G2/mitotic-specific cyclin [Thelocarpon impressellum]